MKLVARRYAPKNSSLVVDVQVTEEQAEVLDNLFKTQDFTAAFWAPKIVCANNGDVTDHGSPIARVNGDHYVLNPDAPNDAFQGLGGRPVEFTFTSGAHAGLQTTCRNTWVQGEIPEELRKFLPDNAVFGITAGTK